MQTPKEKNSWGKLEDEAEETSDKTDDRVDVFLLLAASSTLGDHWT